MVAERGSDRGAVAIIVAVFTIVAMLLLAFVIDRGLIYANRAQLQNAVDAAALAAVQETCGNPIASASSVRAVAVNYGAENGVTIDPANVIVQDGPNDATTGVSVAAEKVVGSFFGGFAGVGDSTVAARGTATRQCRKEFQYVADADFNFNGTGASIEGNIFAGQCFEGNGGDFPGVIAVSSADTFNCGSFHSGAYPIFNGQQQENGTNCPDDIGSCEYDVIGVDTDIAIAAAGYDIPGEVDLRPLTTPNSCSAVSKANIESGPVNCTGNLAIPNNTTVRYDLIASGDINDRNDTVFSPASGRILVYSKTGRIILGTSTNIPSTVVFYAPTPTGQSTQASIQYSGGSQDLDASFIGYDIRANGGGGTGSTGVQIRFAGPWRLSQ